MNSPKLPTDDIDAHSLRSYYKVSIYKINNILNNNIRNKGNLLIILLLLGITTIL